MDKIKVFDRIRGALYGVAVGDCLGAPVEFMSADQIKATYGMVTNIMSGGWLNARVGEGTDDTAMTLAVAEGLMQTGPMDDPVEKIGAEFVKWFYDRPIGTGAACSLSIRYATHEGKIPVPSRDEWYSAALQTDQYLRGRSGGNGSLMRTLPVALFSRGDAQSRLAFDVSQMTHIDSSAASTCLLYCRIVDMLISGKKVRDVLHRVTSGTEYQIATQASFVPNPSGYVKDTFNTALWGLSHLKGFENILVTVVNLGGDADTTGAVVGGLAGAAYGYSAIPLRWVAALDDGLKARLDACALAAGKVWKCWG